MILAQLMETAKRKMSPLALYMVSFLAGSLSPASLVAFPLSQIAFLPELSIYSLQLSIALYSSLWLSLVLAQLSLVLFCPPWFSLALIGPHWPSLALHSNSVPSTKHVHKLYIWTPGSGFSSILWLCC